MSGTCFFIGHRDARNVDESALLETLLFCIRDLGITNFVVGHYGEFDSLAASAVIRLKQQYLAIRLDCLLPYHPAEQPYAPKPGFDETIYPFENESVPKKLRIVRANHYVVDRSDVLIAYVTHIASNSLNLLQYAQQREKRGLIRVFNIGKAASN